MNKETNGNKNNIRVATSISAGDRELLDKYCEDNDITISQLLRRMIHEFFKEN